MAAKILANLIVMGSSILARAFVQAYRQALANVSKNGVAQEAVQNIKRANKTMTEAARRIRHGKKLFRSMTTCLSEMLKMEVFTFNQRYIELKSVWKQFANLKNQKQNKETCADDFVRL